jgi:hypothetical protein
MATTNKPELTPEQRELITQYAIYTIYATIVLPGAVLIGFTRPNMYASPEKTIHSYGNIELHSTKLAS